MYVSSPDEDMYQFNVLLESKTFVLIKAKKRLLLKNVFVNAPVLTIKPEQETIKSHIFHLKIFPQERLRCTCQLKIFGVFDSNQSKTLSEEDHSAPVTLWGAGKLVLHLNQDQETSDF